MNEQDLRARIPVNETSGCAHCCKQQLQGWHTVSDLRTKLTNVGTVMPNSLDNCEIYKAGTVNPFAADSPVTLHYYPYCDSDIYTCPHCAALIFIYLEIGGHVARDQARWIRRELEIIAAAPT